MKNYKNSIRLLLIAILSIALLAGCSKTEPDTTATSDTGAEPEVNPVVAFSYSSGIDDNGHWEGVKALDYVEPFGYKGLLIPNDVHLITEEAVQDEIDYILSIYTTTEEVFDRAVVYGDSVNIDYVGSIDGVEFAGGSTSGNGTVVTAGSPDYIDDFLTQIIDHMPGETFNVEVTFPADYQESSLQGKDAVFVTTINFIVSTVSSELTDEFVETNFFADYEWTTVEEMRETIHKDLQEMAIQDYIMDYLTFEVVADSIPDALINYQMESMKHYYVTYAIDSGIELDEFLLSYVGVTSMEELIEISQEDFVSNARYSLVAQAIAEDADISVTTDDVIAFFNEFIGESEYSSYVADFGLPFLKQMVLQQDVLVFIADNAVLA